MTLDPSNDINLLKQKLKTVSEWHDRAEAMLAHIQRLPDHSRMLRHRFEDPASIPLLQNYDDAILQKEEEIQKLSVEVQELKKRLETNTAEVSEQVKASRVAEERAHVAAEESSLRVQAVSNENAHLRAHISELEAETAALKDRLQAMIIAESRSKDTYTKAVRETDDLHNEVQQLRDKLHRSEQETQSLKRQLDSLGNAREEEQQSTESQKVQLHLLSKENEDKVQEIERLRNKIVHALKQAADNHTTHLKIVEEKHRTVVENLHEQIRAQEAAALRMRAQLSRVEVQQTPPSLSPSAIIDSHARNVQEVELKRLYAEVTSLQLQRDDLQFRMEQLQASSRRDADQAVRDLKRDLELLKYRARDLEERNTKLETELNSQRESNRRIQQDKKLSLEENQRLAHSIEDLEKKLAEALKQNASLSSQLEASRTEHRDALEEERTVAQTMERRLEETKKEAGAERDRLRQQKSELERQLAEERSIVKELQGKVSVSQRSSMEKDLELQNQSAKADRLAQGLALHKQQIQLLDDRLNGMLLAEQQYKRDLRSLTLHVEQLRMDNVRIARERDRLAGEVTTLGAVQRRVTA
jgi:chromosome segregation ATPase